MQHLTPNLIKNRSFTVPVTHLVKQYAQVAVADEDNFYGQIKARANQYEEVTPQAPLNETPPDPLHSSSKKRRRNRRRRDILPLLDRRCRPNRRVGNVGSTMTMLMTTISTDTIKEQNK